MELPGPSREGCGGVKRDHPKSDPGQVGNPHTSPTPSAEAVLAHLGFPIPGGPRSGEPPPRASRGRQALEAVTTPAGKQRQNGLGRGAWERGTGAGPRGQAAAAQAESRTAKGEKQPRWTAMEMVASFLCRGPHPASRPLVASVLLLRMLRGQASSSEQGSAQAPSCPACCVATSLPNRTLPSTGRCSPGKHKVRGSPLRVPPGQRSSGSGRTQVTRRSPAPEPPAGLGQLPEMENCTQGVRPSPGTPPCASLHTRGFTHAGALETNAPLRTHAHTQTHAGTGTRGPDRRMLGYAHKSTRMLPFNTNLAGELAITWEERKSRKEGCQGGWARRLGQGQGQGSRRGRATESAKRGAELSPTAAFLGGSLAPKALSRRVLAHL